VFLQDTSCAWVCACVYKIEISQLKIETNSHKKYQINKLRKRMGNTKYVKSLRVESTEITRCVEEY
jgi:hypothetical protein